MYIYIYLNTTEIFYYSHIIFNSLNIFQLGNSTHYFQICRYLHEIRQHVYGDASHCLISLDSQYSFPMKYYQYRLAVKDYTLTIPFPELDDKTQNTVSKEKQYLLTKIRETTYLCPPGLKVEKYSYKIEEGVVKVTPVRKGDMIRLSAYREELPRRYEHGLNERTNLTVCYPTDIVIDFVNIK